MPFTIQQDVLWLDVAVVDAMSMTVLDCIDEFLKLDARTVLCNNFLSVPIRKREITKALVDAQEALQAPSEEGAVSTSTEGDLEDEGGISLDDIVLRPFGHLQLEDEIDMTRYC